MGRIAAQFDIFDLAGRNVAVLIDEEENSVLRRRKGAPHTNKVIFRMLSQF